MTLWPFLPLLYLAVVTIPLVVLDLRHHRLPNVWVVPGYVVLLIAWIGSGVSNSAVPWVSILCAAAYFGFLFLLAWFGGMGMGDVKLAGVVGGAAGFLGFEVGMLSVLLAFVLGGGVSLGILIRQRVRRSRRTENSSEKSRSEKRIAFGPFILLGFWVALVLHVLA